MIELQIQFKYNRQKKYKINYKYMREAQQRKNKDLTYVDCSVVWKHLAVEI